MVWEFRYYEPDSQGLRQRRSVTVGSIAEDPTESAIGSTPAVQSLMLRINAEGPDHAIVSVTFGAVIARYEREEMPERHSTATSYRSQIKNHIRPRWADVPINSVK